MLLSSISKFVTKNFECKCRGLTRISTGSATITQEYYEKSIKPSYPRQSRKLLCGISAVNLHHQPLQNILSRHHSRNFSTQPFVEFTQRLYIGISESKLVAIFQDLLLTVHSTTGLPWWATIIITSVLVRSAITLPLSIYQNYIIAKVENLTLEMPNIAKEVHAETARAKQYFDWTEEKASFTFKKAMRKQWNLLLIRDNCHPFKASILIWFQIPLWISLSFALRNLVHMRPRGDMAASITATELSIEGFGWIPNLMAVDHTWILPITLGILNLAIIELQVMSKIRKPTRFHNVITNLFRGFSIVLIPVSASVPSCMCLYWASSSAYGLIQNILLMSPKMRRKFGVPLTASEMAHPYQHVYSAFQQRISNLPGLRKQ